MKKTIILVSLAIALMLSTASTALAATQDYSLILPRVQGDKYSSSKSVTAYKDFGVKHKYSGGKTVAFTVCNSSKQAIGARVSIAPGGASAPLTDLWYNNSSASKTILVRCEAASANLVEILAEGTWSWNY